MEKVNIFWFRRDLRLHDNAGLYHALKSNKSVLPIFIFDTNILDKLEDKDDARVNFLYDTIVNLKKELNALGSDLKVFYGDPVEVWKGLIKNTEVSEVFTNEDYEDYAIERDNNVEAQLTASTINFNKYKDHVLFAKKEVVKKDGLPYTVFTPYKRVWLEKVKSRDKKNNGGFYFKSYPTEKYFDNLFDCEIDEIISLKEMGFEKSLIKIPSTKVAQKVIKEYTENRNFPSINGTSKLGIHFRFGTISIREKARKAMKLNDTFLSELVWRDFYAQILHNFPHVEKNSFRAKYERIEWLNNEEHYEAWQQGRTGYPLVDAGMRELNTTGFMHNRVRMLVASFLTKHLLIDWRWGEAYFARKLLDFDLASNNGGWQWAAGCGTDAAPYFRIFSPEAQLKKFDKKLIYVKKWVPEFGTYEYPDPIVDHKMARERCLTTYKEALNQE